MSRESAARFAGQIKEGFVGNTVMIQRKALAKIGVWDERIQAGDFDLYLRTKQRAEQVGAVVLCLQPPRGTRRADTR